MHAWKTNYQDQPQIKAILKDQIRKKTKSRDQSVKHLKDWKKKKHCSNKKYFPSQSAIFDWGDLVFFFFFDNI
jgi:hypothetical protein